MCATRVEINTSNYEVFRCMGQPVKLCIDKESAVWSSKIICLNTFLSLSY